MRVLVSACLLSFATATAAQDDVPRDAPYFATPQSVVERMLALAQVGASDFVMDLGSGDGRIVITAAKKYGASGLGIEIDPQLVSAANWSARGAGVGERVKFVKQDLFETDLRPATVLTLYLFQELNLKLRPRILAQLRPGARVVTHDWHMGDWPPDHTEIMAAPDKPVGINRESKIFMWIVPARLQGRWRIDSPLAPGGATLTLAQRYQQFDGVLEHGGARYGVSEGRANGAQVAFRIAEGPLAGDYAGTASDSAIAGEMKRGGTTSAWRAAR